MEALREWRVVPQGRSTSKQLKVKNGGRTGLLKSLDDTDVTDAMKNEDKNLMQTSGGPQDKSSWHDQNTDTRKALITKKAWDVALTPVKALAMNVVMIFMTGAGGGFFGFIIIGYALLQAVRILIGVNKSFNDLEKSAEGIKVNTVLQRLTYTLLAAGMTGYFLYQAAKIGLLPTSQSGTNIDLSQSTLLTNVGSNHVLLAA